MAHSPQCHPFLGNSRPYKGIVEGLNSGGFPVGLQGMGTCKVINVITPPWVFFHPGKPIDFRPFKTGPLT